jgi:hypothetical protein
MKRGRTAAEADAEGEAGAEAEYRELRFRSYNIKGRGIQ